MDVLKQLDLFRVVQDKEKHLTPATKHGATATVLMLALLGVLLTSETMSYVSGTWQCTIGPRAMAGSRVSANPSPPSSLPLLHASIVFPYIPCHRVGVSTNSQGAPQAELNNRTVATRYYVPRGEFRPDVSRLVLSQPDDTQPAVGSDAEDSGGCYMEVTAPLSDVPASLNFYVVNYNLQQDAAMKPDHYIRQLYAGERNLAGMAPHISPATTRPLTDVTRNVTHLRGQARYAYHYYLQFIETSVETAQQAVKDYQFTESWSTAFFYDHRHVPGVYLAYRHSTFAVHCDHRHDTLSHFVVHLCAVVGGVYVVAGIVEALVEYTAAQRHKRFQAAQHTQNTMEALRAQQEDAR